MNKKTINNQDSFAYRWGDDVASRGFYMKPRCLMHCTAELGLTPAEALVLDHLFGYWFDYTKPPDVWPSENTIGNALGFVHSTAGRHVRNLETKGFLDREERSGMSNIYHLEHTIAKVREHILSTHPP